MDADTQVVVGSAFLLEDEEREEPGLRAFLEGHPVRVLYIYMYKRTTTHATPSTQPHNNPHPN